MLEPAAAKGQLEPLVIGRYALFDVLASGGMATVHLGRLLGAVGFGRTVAVKRLHSQYTSDQEFVTMFMDEARIVARIRHPNVVPMVDVIESSKGLFLVMEYVHGESLSKLLRTCRAAGEAIPINLVNTVLHGVLLGLHAAHDTKGGDGELLDIVHRDVSPQNVMVGADGVARVLDFGVAKAAGRAQVTREGQIKGKLAYMAPEQIRGQVDRRADVFAAAIVLWEALAGRRLHDGAKDVEIVSRVVQGGFPAPSQFRADIPPELDAIVMRGLDIDPDKRYPNAREMALDLERRVGLVSTSVVGEWVERLAFDALKARAESVAAMEKVSSSLVPADSVPALRAAPVANPYASSPHPGAESFVAPKLGYRTPSLPDGVHRGGGGVVERRPAFYPGGPQSESSFRADGWTETGATASTPHIAELPARAEPPPQGSDRTVFVAVGSFCAALAIIGIVLGAYSLYVRRSAALASSVPPPSAAPSSSPSVAEPSVATFPTTSGPATSSARPGTGASNSGPNMAPAPHRTATPQASSTAPKKGCDPPYTLDEAGHRHYRLECMGVE